MPISRFNNMPAMPATSQPAGIYKKPGTDLPIVLPADVLVVLAHPDDEFFMSGTIAKLARNNISIQLIYLTSGDKGPDDSGRNLEGTRAFTKEREYELYSSLKTLGIDRLPILLRHGDGKTDQQSTSNRIKVDLSQIMPQVNPKLVITFGPDGVYGHKDHINAGRLTDIVCQELGYRNIYHIAFSMTGKQTMTEAYQKYLNGLGAPIIDNWHWNEPNQISTKINVGGFLPLKVQVLKCHQTQFNPQVVSIFKQFYMNHPTEEFTKVQ
jgi:LmbE family N-acetylglucosaminyl deacetylase